MVREPTDKYARLAISLADRARKKVDRFALAQTLWNLADYLQAQDNGKHEQHLIQLGVKWINGLGRSDG